MFGYINIKGLRSEMSKINLHVAAAWMRGTFRLPRTPKGQKLDMSRFALTWSDEFDGGSLDRGKWTGDFEPRPNKGGYEYIELAQVKDGMLHISPVYSEQGIAGGPPGYYAAWLETRGLFEQKFGYFEARCKLPKGIGLWSAFWMHTEQVHKCGPARDGTEIDIYESPYWRRRLPLLKNAVSTNLHYGGYFNQTWRMHNVGIFRVREPYDTFHTYGLEWNENEYIFYIDGVESGRSSFGGVSQTEQYLLLSVEHNSGGTNSWAWAGDARKNKPGDMTDFVVDYVRAYQYK